MHALIQKRQCEIATVNGHTAFIGFRERGYAIHFFEGTDFAATELTPDSIVVGGVPVISQALERLGIPFPSQESIPDVLADFAQRKVWQTSIGELPKQLDDRGPFFS